MGKKEGSPLPASAVSAAVPSHGWADSLTEAPSPAVASLQRFRVAADEVYLEEGERVTTPGFAVWDFCRTAGAEESASSQEVTAGSVLLL